MLIVLEVENDLSLKSSTLGSMDCEFCDRGVKVHPLRRYKMCIDCLVKGLSDAKIVRTGFDYSVTKDEKTCEVCITKKIPGHRITSLCIDCICESLKRVNMLHLTESRKRLKVKMVYDDSPRDQIMYSFHKRSNHTHRRYKECACCDRGRFIEREYPVCIDCIIELCIQSDLFEIETVPGIRLGRLPVSDTL